MIILKSKKYLKFEGATRYIIILIMNIYIFKIIRILTTLFSNTLIFNCIENDIYQTIRNLAIYIYHPKLKVKKI